MLVDFSLEDIDFIQKLIETKEENLLSNSEIELGHRLYDKLSQKPKTLEELGWELNVEFKNDEKDKIIDFTFFDERQYQYINLMFNTNKKYIDTHRVYLYDIPLLIAIANKASELFKE